MEKFYKVDVFEKAYGNKDFPLASNFEEKCIGQVIVKKKLFVAKEVITDFEIQIEDNESSYINGFNINRYGRDLYIKKSYICDSNRVDFEEIEKYIDEFDYDNFCLNNELEIDRKIDKKYKDY